MVETEVTMKYIKSFWKQDSAENTVLIMRSLEDSEVQADEWQGIVATIKHSVHHEVEKTRSILIKTVQQENRVGENEVKALKNDVKDLQNQMNFMNETLIDISKTLKQNGGSPMGKTHPPNKSMQIMSDRQGSYNTQGSSTNFKR